MNETPNPSNEISGETCCVPNSSALSNNGTVYRVYGLCDPRFPLAPRYIGMTTDLLSRIRKHRTRPNSAATLAWFAELATLKLEACCIVLHEFPSELEARHKESELINSLPNLLNGDCSIPVKLLPEPSGNSLAAVEMRHILATIHLHNGNKLAASKALGIGRQTLYNKLSAL